MKSKNRGNHKRKMQSMPSRNFHGEQIKSESSDSIEAKAAAVSNDRQIKRMNLYKSFTDLLKSLPALIAFATAGAFLKNGTYPLFEYQKANALMGQILYIFAIAGAFCTSAVFADSAFRFLVHRNSKKAPYLFFGTLLMLCVTSIPMFAFNYVLIHHQWIVAKPKNCDAHGK